MSKSYSINDVKKYIDEFSPDIVLISSEYKNIDTELDFICGCGNKFTTTFFKFKKLRTKGCEKCRKERWSQNSSNSLKGHQGYFKGKKLSDSHKQNISKGMINSEIFKNRDFHLSESTKLKIGAKLKGRKISEQTREKMSKASKGRRHSEESKLKLIKKLMKNKNALGHKHTEESKEKMKIVRSTQVFSDEIREKMSLSSTKYWNSLDEETKFIKNQKRFNNIKSKDTDIEIITENQLKLHNINYKKQYWIHDKANKRSFCFDFILPEYNLIIECDGDYWHNSEKAKNRDKSKNDFVMSKNVKILRILGSKILDKNFDILCFLKNYDIDPTLDINKIREKLILEV